MQMAQFEEFSEARSCPLCEVVRVMALASDLLGFLHDIPALVPREVAAAAGVRQVWNVCNTWRQRNRQMYLRIMVAKSIGGQALLAARMAMSVCMLRLGTLLLPCEVLLRIMQFVVASTYHIEIPVSLVTWRSAVPGTGYFLTLMELRRGHLLGHIGTVNALVGLELHIMTRIDLRLHRLVDDAERNSENIRLGPLVTAARRASGVFERWLRELPIEITTSLPVLD